MRIRSLALALIAAGIALAIVLVSQALLQRAQDSPPAEAEARAVYQQRCAVCHGSSGKGDGPGAAVTAQRIPDFSNPEVMRGATDRFLFEIIQKGGSQFGRSNAMPAWGIQLTDDQIRSLVRYIRSLAAPPAGGPGRKETP
jgi:mono/diheme cytochrome c family protein